MSLRILVTGSSGFIGQAVSSVLAEAGHRVRAASRKPNRTPDQADIEWIELPDLEKEVDWSPLVEGMDVVVHLAAIAHRSEADAAITSGSIMLRRRLWPSAVAATRSNA